MAWKEVLNFPQVKLTQLFASLVLCYLQADHRNSKMPNPSAAVAAATTTTSMATAPWRGLRFVQVHVPNTKSLWITLLVWAIIGKQIAGE